MCKLSFTYFFVEKRDKMHDIFFLTALLLCDSKFRYFSDGSPPVSIKRKTLHDDFCIKNSTLFLRSSMFIFTLAVTPRANASPGLPINS